MSQLKTEFSSPRHRLIDVKRIRQALGLSQRQLAERLKGITIDPRDTMRTKAHEKVISRWENGWKEPNAANRRRLEDLELEIQVRAQVAKEQAERPQVTTTTQVRSTPDRTEGTVRRQPLDPPRPSRSGGLLPSLS